ncbi:MAG: AI-2E family transporter [Cyclobacteriaceae bacterium]|nr:AI-2E family transporter [Cyclobacteriaceae bacterium]
MNISFQKMFYAIATTFALFAICVVARSILIPISFALLNSFILLPLAKRFEKWGVNGMLSALFAILASLILLGGGIYLFSAQIISISREFSHFQEKIIKIFAEATTWLNGNMRIIPNLEKGELMEQLKNWINNSSGSLVKQTFSGSAGFVAGLIATIIFTFLFLIYREGFKHAFVLFYPEEKREAAMKMLKSIQLVGKKYLTGVILIVIIIGMINSITLLIIGIDYPLFFGFLAAILAIIPYVGTTIGATIPVMYAFMTYDSIWTPIAVAISFWFIQVVESNYLSPKIVGGSLKVNALAAIISIIIGASVWGVAGMILFLPFTAMLKVVCQEYEELKPIAMFIGEQNVKEKSIDIEALSKWKSKLKNWFLN